MNLLGYIKRCLVPLTLVIWLLFGLYVGLGGISKAEFDEKLVEAQEDEEQVEFNGVVYKSVEELHKMLMKQRVGRFFGWAFALPPLAALALSAFSFGAVGGVTRVVARSVMSEQTLTLEMTLTWPLFGALVGLLLLGATHVIPVLLATGSTSVRPSALLFLALLGGAYTDKVYAWSESRLSALLTTNSSRE